MHELALTEKILKLVLQEAEAHHAVKINGIKLAVGELSGIVESCVEFYFQLIAKGTIAADSKLEFRRIGANLYCPECKQEFKKEAKDFCCPLCGNLARLTESGQECTVESIEVDGDGD